MLAAAHRRSVDQEVFSMLAGLKAFLLKGNAIDLAIGAMIGAMFGSVVESFTKGLIDPLLGGLVGKPNFDEAVNIPFMNGSSFKLGLVITALFNFILKGAVIYFFIVVPMKKALDAMKKEEAAAAPAAPPAQEVLLKEIRDLLAKR
jgi:large conductance mechanosensitive channel